MQTIVLVEGLTDELAVTLAATRLGRKLEAAGVAIVRLNGAHGVGPYLRRMDVIDRPASAGLYDQPEEAVIEAALRRAGYGPAIDQGGLEAVGFFACRADLEDELIRAAGEATVSRLIEREGDGQAWQKFRRQQAWHDRPFDQQFRRFIRSVSDRNSRYIRAIVETIDPGDLPRPIRLLLDYIRS